MIYIQQHDEFQLPAGEDAACALYGAISSGHKFKLLSLGELRSGKFDYLIRRNLCVGSVEFMTEVFGRQGIHNVRLPFNRYPGEPVVTVAEAIDTATTSGKLFHIKPVSVKSWQARLIGGDPFTGTIHDLNSDDLCFINPAFEAEIVTEWRYYIVNGKVIDCRQYAGDIFLSPDKSEVLNHLKWAHPASAYTADFALLANGTTVLVELNDAWAIGNYGIPNDLYLNFLKVRYTEITDPL